MSTSNQEPNFWRIWGLSISYHMDIRLLIHERLQGIIEVIWITKMRRLIGYPKGNSTRFDLGGHPGSWFGRPPCIMVCNIHP